MLDFAFVAKLRSNWIDWQGRSCWNTISICNGLALWRSENVEPLFAFVAHEVGHAILQEGIDDLLNKLFEHFLPNMELSNEVWVENYVKKYYKEANEEIVKRITCCKNMQKRTINITRFDIIKASCGGHSADCKGKGF